MPLATPLSTSAPPTFSTRVTAHVDAETALRLEDLAKRTGASRSHILRWALSNALDELELKAAEVQP
jgi:Ribbon-helix-helix protein, copG family.